MLYISEKSGVYTVAPKEVIMQEALRASQAVLLSGAPVISESMAKDAIGAQLCGFENEVVGCLFLNTAHQILGWEILFHGTINKTQAYPRIFVKKSLEYNAASIIVAHNHPSGSTTPSKEDLHLTEILIRTLGLIDVTVLDHLIVGNEIVSLSTMGHMAILREKITKIPETELPSSKSKSPID